ncbi:MAG TPA: chromate efflux transporter [Acidimicrobiia bacterium]|nr:chromate efflux transporter [Acidimicrobiia bacterium]
MSGPHAEDVTLRQATRVWWLVGLNSFGGPGAQIPMMHRMLVEERRWISERRFLHGVNFTMLLPGPEAQQFATYIGWLLHGIKGGLVAGGLFILPGFVAILGLSIVYVTFGDTRLVEALFYGIKPAVLAIVATAVVRLGRRAVRTKALAATAVLGFILLFFFDVAFPLVIVTAGGVGFLVGRLRPAWFVGSDGGHAPDVPTLIDDGVSTPTDPRRASRVAVAGLMLWLLPVGVAGVVAGASSVWFELGAFFAVAAVVTFGGAYAVLSFVAQQAVQVYGWLMPGEMVDGLGMAESTPGPAIQVVQLVGFIGAYRLAGQDPMTAAILGAALVTWVTFVPCFLWIFVGGPYVDRVRDHPSLTTTLSAITAVVVGVIANLAAWFALHTLFGELAERTVGPMRLLVPRWSSIDVLAAGLAVAGVVALTVLRWPLLRVIAVLAVAGAVVHALA